jgi:hypothetical protein
MALIGDLSGTICLRYRLQIRIRWPFSIRVERAQGDGNSLSSTTLMRRLAVTGRTAPIGCWALFMTVPQST